ncbi:MAG: lipoyl domain-containing protein [Geminicoccales bacterium]
MQPGDNFTESDILYEIETEKVGNKVEAPCYGVMLEHLADEGDDTPISDDVCGIDKQD